MKLKQLHIRNIASIERADIDFEHDLDDAITGAPAPIFLISGDTGAGKSVILDGISMALYKKTPRIADVANATKNEYTDNEGESIRVASIDQYTRLGISEKDESYSEVVFEGNDGRVYHARLTLGMMLGNRDKTTGQRPLKHRTPKWEVKIDDGDWTKDSVEQTILHAVGLEFQQFGRMAMLAQGQFANFLTGDKKEREAILEQLTNTQHFTAYGEAIQSLYKKAKETLALVKTQYDTEKPHTLTDDEVQQIGREQKECQQQIDNLDKTIKAIDEREKHTGSVVDNEKVIAETQLKIQELETQMTGEDYLHHKKLIADWDSTSNERQLLSELLKARQEKDDAREALKLLRDTFDLLSADMSARQDMVKALERNALQTQAWIDQRREHETLFKKAGETDLRMGQYLEAEKKRQETGNLLASERSKTALLMKTEEEALKAAQEMAETVKTRQDEIDRLNKERMALNPQVVNEKLKQQNEQKQHLTELQTNIGNLKPLTEESQRLRSEILAEEKQLAELKEAYTNADANYLEKKREADATTKRLTTMEMSLDKKIKELRHRLLDEGSKHCPLCGQPIEHIHLDDEFKDMLTPLETEQKKATNTLKLAESRRDKTHGELQQLDGSHKTKQSQLKATDLKIARAQQSIREKAGKAGLDVNKDLETQIATAIEILASSIEKLEATQLEAEKMQACINEKLEAKKTLDQEKNKADRLLVDAENKVRNNAETIRGLEEKNKEQTKACEALRADISSTLKGYCDEWIADIEGLRKQLRSDAEAFSNHQQLLSDTLVRMEKANALTGSLQHIQQSIIQVCRDWETVQPSKSYSCQDIHTEWTNLLKRVTSLASKQKECDTIIVRSEEMLAAYYQQTGKNQQSLLALMGQEHQIEGARNRVNDMNAQLRSRRDAMTEAQRQRDAALTALGISDRADLPDLEQLEEQKAATLALRDEAIAKLSEANSRLQTHNENARHLKEIEVKLGQAKQRYARWDRMNSIFGGTRFRTLVQTYILRPLLNNANIYLEQITDRYRLTCSEDNEQLSILVLDRYNKEQVRSVTVLSGGERFMISLALSLALSSLNRPDMNVNILFIDEGFGTLDEHSLDSVMTTLEKLQEIAGQTNRRVGIISHREELEERIPVKIQVVKKGEGRSQILVNVDYN